KPNSVWGASLISGLFLKCVPVGLVAFPIWSLEIAPPDQPNSSPALTWPPTHKCGLIASR
ncbi:MAG: hypothetical protein ACXWPG_10045, partial [Ktedonobacteraceae bacterium]